MVIQEIKIFLASSAELQTERDAVHKFKDEVGKEFPQFKLELVKWETDLPSGSISGSRVQDDINPLLESCEIVFVLFYSKAGNFTIEELRLAETKGKKVFVYFKTGFTTTNPDRLNTYGKVLELRGQLDAKNHILFKEYLDDRDFEKIFKEDLQKQLRTLLPDLDEPLTPPLPDQSTLLHSLPNDAQPNRRIKILLSEELQYDDLDSFRLLPANRLMREYYYKREADRKLQEALSDPSRHFILVKGMPLAGKTRACLEALRVIPGLQLLLPELYNSKFWQIEPGDEGSMVILNDFDVYCEVAGKEVVNQFLHQCFAHKVRVLVTCKTGSEYNILRDSVKTRFWENLVEVKIPKLQYTEFSRIEGHFLAKDIRLDKEAYRRLDYNVGSLFLDLKTMRERYRKIKNESNGLPCAVLQTLKAFFVGYNRLQDGSYSKKKIKFYLERYDGQEYPLAMWDKAFSRLESSDTGDGFLRFTEKGNILIEEAYLRVVLDDVPDRKYLEEIEELFPDAGERTEFGFFGVQYWTIKLNEKARLSQKEGEDFLQEMTTAGIKPDAFVFNNLINKAVHRGTAHFWLDKMLEAGVEPDTVTFNSLIPLCKDLAQGFEILERMKLAKVEPVTVTFSSLIPLCKDLAQGFEILERMKLAKVEPVTVTFSSLIPLCKNLAQGFEILEKMKLAKVEPVTVTFSSLIPLCKDLEQGFEILERMELAKVERNTVTFTSLINVAIDAESARLCFDKMISSGCDPNIFTISTLLKKCARDCTSIVWVESLRQQHGIEINEVYQRQVSQAKQRYQCE